MAGAPRDHRRRLPPIGAILCIVFIILANVATASATSDDGLTSLCTDSCEQQTSMYTDSECQSYYRSSCSITSPCESQCASSVDACNNDPTVPMASTPSRPPLRPPRWSSRSLGVPTLIFSCIAFGSRSPWLKCLKGRKANMAEGGPSVKIGARARPDPRPRSREGGAVGVHDRPPPREAACPIPEFFTLHIERTSTRMPPRVAAGLGRDDPRTVTTRALAPELVEKRDAVEAARRDAGRRPEQAHPELHEKLSKKVAQ